MSTEDLFAKHIVEPEPNQTLWHYMSFAKFMSLLDTSSLFFSQLKNLNDPFEGIPFIDHMPIGSEFEKMYKSTLEDPNSWRHYIVVTCWSANSSENLGMWNTYASKFGITIKSTVQRLNDGLNFASESEVFRGLVMYDRAEGEPGDNWSIFFDIFHNKRKEFENENEYRIARGYNDPKQRYMINLAGGILIPVNLNRLIDKIVISPESPNWFLGLVQSITRKNGLSIEVTHSEIDRKPFV